MSAADPLGRFASTAQEDVPRAASNRDIADHFAQLLGELDDDTLAALATQEVAPVTCAAARRELARRGVSPNMQSG